MRSPKQHSAKQGKTPEQTLKELLERPSAAALQLYPSLLARRLPARQLAALVQGRSSGQSPAPARHVKAGRLGSAETDQRTKQLAERINRRLNELGPASLMLKAVDAAIEEVFVEEICAELNLPAGTTYEEAVLALAENALDGVVDSLGELTEEAGEEITAGVDLLAHAAGWR